MGGIGKGGKENMKKDLWKKGIVCTIILLFLGAGTIPGISGNQINDAAVSENSNKDANQMLSDIEEPNLETYNKNMETENCPLNSNSEVILETSFEEEWILDGDGDYLAPPGWDVDGICVGHQSSHYPFLTHYWSDMHEDEYQKYILTHDGNISVCVWWSNGIGESQDVGKNQDEWLITPELDFSLYYQVELSFWSIHHYNSSKNHSNYIKVSTDNGDTWDTITDLVHDEQWEIGGEHEGWEEWNHYEYPIVIDLADYARENSVRIAWQQKNPSPGMGLGGAAIWVIDDLAITGLIDTKIPEISLERPKESTIYLNNEEIYQWSFPTFIIGPIDIDIDVFDEDSGVDYVELFINNESKTILNDEPYLWTWSETGFGKFTIKAKAYDNFNNYATTEEMTVFKLF